MVSYVYGYHVRNVDKKMKVKNILMRSLLDLGDYLLACLNPPTEKLGMQLHRIPESGYGELFSTTCRSERSFSQSALVEGYKKEIEFIKGFDPAETIILTFTDWELGHPESKFCDWYKRELGTYIKVFWSREDPTHFDLFQREADMADIICTSALECVPKYMKDYPDKKVICTPMACSPEVFYPNTDWDSKEFDIVFVGNRYPGRSPRTNGEEAVIYAAADYVPKAEIDIVNGAAYRNAQAVLKAAEAFKERYDSK